MLVESVENKEAEDFNFYNEEDFGEKSVEMQGITGKVTPYTFTGVTYPCVLFKEDFNCPRHKLTVISNMVKSGGKLNKDISIYFLQKGDVFKIGSLSGFQINAFIDLVGKENLTGFYDKDTQLSGDKLYTLNTVF